MPNRANKKRLTQIESAIQPKPIGVVWFGNKKHVKVGNAIMTLKNFKTKYPNGILIYVVREDKST